ncbi:MAG: hypothetical protein M3Z50_14245 [Actinomycetota bacterium]|nr:hypothetical protein [Actinomycetota bacterium]
MTTSLKGLRSVIYPTPELDSAKSWWTAMLGVEPYEALAVAAVEHAALRETKMRSAGSGRPRLA